MEPNPGAAGLASRVLRVTVLTVVVLVLAAACGSSAARARINTPHTAAGLATARTTMERALARADTKTLRAFYSEKSCTTGKQGHQLESLLAMLEPTERRSSIRVATRNVTSERGEVRVRTHYSAPGESGSVNGDWEPWRYDDGRWRADCTRRPQPATGSDNS